MWRFLFILLFASPAAAQQNSISIAGPETLYLSHKEMNCGRTERGSGRDGADIPVTAFRRKDGSVVVLAGNQNNYYLEGPSVDKARRTSCKNLVKPVNDPDPQAFNARRWLFAIHAKSYDFVLGFVHNEYHGNDHFAQGCEKSSQRNFECWYGSTTLVISRDGGFTFKTPPYPDNVLAALPFRFEVGRKRAGANTPKVVGNPHDGMIYVMVNYFDRNRNIRGSQCLLRGSGKKFNDWRAWDGAGFNLDMESPYAIQPSGADCAAVLPFIVHSLKYVPNIGKFIAIGTRDRRVLYAFSADLINWSKETTLMEFEPHQTWKPGMPAARAYFSLLDPESRSNNFDTLENSPQLYFVQFGTDDARRFLHKTDIYRVPIQIQ